MFISEERQVADRIKDFIKNEGSPEKVYYNTYIMLRNGRILYIGDYRDMVDSGKINPMDAYVYFVIYKTSSMSDFYYPILGWVGEILNAYLSKLGFHSGDFAVPATGLKYVAAAVGYEKEYISERYLSIEVTDLNTTSNNANLPKIVSEVLGAKLVSGEKELTYKEHNKIDKMFRSQKLFAGHNVDDARELIYKYYDEGNQSLAKEVARIAIDYYRIFNSYTVCYDRKTWKEINCWSIKLD